MKMNSRVLLGALITSMFGNVTLFLLSWPHLKVHVFAIKDEESDLLEAAPIKVRVATVKMQPITRKITINGTTKASDVVPIVSDFPGTITSINFKQGDLVKKGDVLVQLDDRPARAELQQASAQLKQLQAILTRQKILAEKKYSAASVLEKAEADVASAQANVAKASLALQKTQILAPFDGEIGLRNVSVGSHVDPNHEITRLVRSDPLEVDFHVPESEVISLFEGQELEILVEGYDILPMIGKILAVEPYSDPIGHTVRVRAELENPENKIKDGAFARVTIPLTKSENALVIPIEAVHHRGFVFVLNDDRLVARAVTLSAQENGLVEVTEGLKLGETVIVDPVESLEGHERVVVDTSE
jgi:membrane fusion protein, multidrug efflux system